MFAITLRLGLFGIALGLLATFADADDKKADERTVELKVGDVAPTFQLRDDRDKTWSSSDHFGKRWVVIYFYPGDFTPGCTAQAKAFATAMDKLTETGVEVVGVSGDSVEIHERFKKSQKLNFTLLSGEDGTIAKRFGVPFTKGATVKPRDARGKPLEVDGKPFSFERKGTAARWTFVVGKDGTIVYKNTKVVPANDAKKITEFIAEAEKK